MKNIDPLSQEVLTSIFKTSSKDQFRIVKREDSRIEFKESYSHAGMGQYFKTIASFANNNGGYIIFGVSDKPRKLVGLKERSLQQFEDLSVETFTQNLCEYFSPVICWTHCTFVLKGLSFGIIYIYPLDRKPCICKKNFAAKNETQSLKEGDIYYRYCGRSERIRYSELSGIIEESRKKEEREWIKFLTKAGKIGISNAGLLDISSGQLTSNAGGSNFIDEKLLKEIAFIKEGEFNEVEGKPTLKLIGTIQEISTGRTIMTGKTTKIIKGVLPTDVIESFLKDEDVSAPLEYIKQICFGSSGNMPVYFYVEKTGYSKEKVVELIEKVNSRGKAKKMLLKRFNGRLIEQRFLKTNMNDSLKEKQKYKNLWIEEKIPEIVMNKKYFLQSVLYLTNEELRFHEKYIRKELLKLFKNFYDTFDSPTASDFRNAICRLDEVLYNN